MESEAPNRKNFTTSKVFRKWLIENPVKETSTSQTKQSTGQTSTELSILIPQLILKPVHLPANVQEDQTAVSIINQELQETEQEDQTPDNIITQALQEALGESAQPEPVKETVQVPLPELMPQLNSDRVSELINELVENQNLQDLLERADVDVNEDKGIELNRFEEIEMDIEPFDFDIEVDLFYF